MEHAWQVIRTFLRLLAFGIPLVAACSTDEQISRAEVEVSEFHKKFNAGEFQIMYDRSSDEFKQNARKEDMVRFFEGVRSKLGEVTNTKKTGWHVNHHSSGTIVTLTCETQFSKGNATEVFIYRIAGQNMILAGYRIDSRDLVVQ